MIKAVILDFDGVIADTYDMVYSICNSYGFAITHKVLKTHHDGNVYETPKIPFDKGMLKEYIKEYNKRLDKKYLFPIKDEIEKLYSDYKLFIISSNSEKGILHFLDLTNLGKYFSKVMGMETDRSKVKKFQMLFDKYNINPEECVFITDTLGDLKEGKEAGVKTVAVTWGFHNEERLQKGKPDLMINEIKDIYKKVCRV